MDGGERRRKFESSDDQNTVKPIASWLKLFRFIMSRESTIWRNATFFSAKLGLKGLFCHTYECLNKSWFCLTKGFEYHLIIFLAQVYVRLSETGSRLLRRACVRVSADRSTVIIKFVGPPQKSTVRGLQKKCQFVCRE
jgi:hypothetical protein